MIKYLNWSQFGSSSIYKWAKSFELELSLPSPLKSFVSGLFPYYPAQWPCVILFSSSDGGKKGGEGGGRAPAAWESIWSDISVIVMSPLFSIDLQRGKLTIKRVEELNYKYSKRLQVDLLRDSREVCR